jgi:hypothetical protein
MRGRYSRFRETQTEFENAQCDDFRERWLILDLSDRLAGNTSDTPALCEVAVLFAIALRSDSRAPLRRVRGRF